MSSASAPETRAALPRSCGPVDEHSRSAADEFVGRLLDAAADDRPHLLESLRIADPPLFALVASLTAHLDSLDAFLERPIVVPSPEDRMDAFAGKRFGHWLVLRSIGRGGMGLVFEVERADGVVRQRAALKLIKRSADDESIARRFATERQILAGLEHPSIARLIDAGASAEGRPYLVMEFVDGVPLDAWCTRHALTIEQRIRLFNEICSAVQYAHQRLVVHRDLKPTNILVTADGTPKLLDFGISKLLDLDASSDATVDASTLLTPRYASPEQLTGGPISTASDVYSLGVLLFELLTDRLPYETDGHSLIAMMRAVMTQEPARPSVAVLRTADGPADAASTPAIGSIAAERRGETADSRRRRAQRLRGDLDHILMKALAKEPADRYESAAALRDDLARHLAGDPIKALAPSWRYRARKFVRKYRLGVGLATALALTIVSLGAMAAWEAVRADRARDLAEQQRLVAERRFEETRQLAKTMMFDVDDAIATGPTKAREQLVRTALTYLDRLSHDQLTPDLERDVAAGYERIADILGATNANNLGRPAEARDYLNKALALRERIARTDPTDRGNLAGLIGINRDLGALARFAGAPAQAADYFATATRFAETRARLDPNDADATEDVFARRRDEALIRYIPGRPNLNRYDEAMQRYRRLLADMEAYIARHPERVRVPAAFDPVLNDMTRLSRLGGDSASALATSQRSLRLSERQLEREPDNPKAVRDLFLSLRATGDSLMELGRDDEGLALLRRSQVLRRAAHAADPSSALAARDAAIGSAMMGYAFEFSNRPREGLDEYRDWARQAEAALQKSPDNKGHRLDLEQARCSVAEMLLALGQSAQALATARRVAEEVIAFEGANPEDEEAREALGKARLIAARAMVATKTVGDAFDLAKRGVANLEVNERKTPDDAFAARDAARGRVQAGRVGAASGADRVESCGLIASGRDGLQRLADQKRLPTQFVPFLAEADAAMARCARSR